MSISETMKKQWDGYADYHRCRANLVIHIIAVPVFLVGTIGFLAALIRGDFGGMVTAIVVMAVAMGAQGYGHSQEERPAEPFAGPADALVRIFLEQWLSFPRFVASGKWQEAYGRATRG